MKCSKQRDAFYKWGGKKHRKLLSTPLQIFPQVNIFHPYYFITFLIFFQINEETTKCLFCERKTSRSIVIPRKYFFPLWVNKNASHMLFNANRSDKLVIPQDSVPCGRNVGVFHHCQLLYRQGKVRTCCSSGRSNQRHTLKGHSYHQYSYLVNTCLQPFPRLFIHRMPIWWVHILAELGTIRVNDQGRLYDCMTTLIIKLI